MKKIGIIDPVGIKAGMDYYDRFLLEGMKRNGIVVRGFSNYGDVDTVKVFNINLKNKFTKLLNFVYGLLVASIYCLKLKIKVVILHSFSYEYKDIFCFLLMRLFKRKVIMIAHDISSFADNDTIWIKKLIFNRLSDYIIVHNQFSKETIVKSGILQNLSNLKVIKHGGFVTLPTNKTKFDARMELKFKSEKKYVLFFGQIKKVKGLDILLKGFAKANIDNLELIIAGKPWKHDFKEYDYLISQLNISKRVHKLIRFINDDERDLLFKASDLLVLPYREIYQSGVLLMAMSYGLPLICSDLPANKEVINGENGLLFKSEDFEELSERMKEIIDESNNKLSSIRLNALNTIIEEFDWTKIAKEYLEFL